MILDKNLANQISVYVRKLYSKYAKPYLIYHNLAHIQNVVNRANEIALNYLLNETDTFIVLCAAWFHDCGHLFGPEKDHEHRSASFMKAYLDEIGVEANITQLIQTCILSTKLPNNPQSLLEKILCDADLYHLGTDDFFITDKLVQKEFVLRNNYLPERWDENSLSFLKSHIFHTEYCRALLEKGKSKNITILEYKINSMN